MRVGGAYVLGKTQTHELGVGFTTRRTPKGPVHNPYSSQGVIAGGAAGGLAAAIASRVAPVGIALDSLGDARIPAHCCGVFAFRPSPHRFSTEGSLVLSSSLDSVAFLARNVRDLQLLDAFLTAERIVGGFLPEETAPPAAASTAPAGAKASPTSPSKGGAGGAGGAAPGAAAPVASEEEVAAAVKIQSITRGRLARREAEEMRSGESTTSGAGGGGAGSAATGADGPGAAAAAALDAHGGLDRLNKLLLGAAGDASAASDPALVGSLRGLRVGIAPLAFHADTDSAVQAVVETLITRLRAAGAEVVEAELSADLLSRSLQIANAVRRWEAPREWALFLARHHLDRDHPVFDPFHPNGPPKAVTGDGDDGDGDGDGGDDGDGDGDGAGAKGPATSRLCVADILDALAASSPDEAATLRSSLDAATPADTLAYLDVLVRGRQQVQDAVAAHFERHRLDVLLYPTAPVPAVRPDGAHDEYLAVGDVRIPTVRGLPLHTALAAVAALPAVTLPAGMTKLRPGTSEGASGSERLPVGVELAGRTGSDASLLAIARAVEALVAPLPDPILRSKWAEGVSTKHA